MSFKADRPFYPYREPETEQTKPATEARLLRVFFAAPVRYAGKLGDGTKPWPGQTVWAGPVDAPHWTALYQKLAPTQVPTNGVKPALVLPVADGLWLTEFEDRSAPRPGTDEVYFEPAADQSPVARPPHVITSTRTVMVTPWWHLAVYIGGPTVLVLGGLGAWRLTRTK
jgi:hypothetical protein